ncbi:adenosylcobinamide-GDP ribazoletransferase [Actinokineospora globicatena]|uniref:adenosylcobinamide-GDP ribazoletransferase n=1 Tax=Actinokineospora globicatena TaxID=103729 RepID=UPI0020A40009|nr:adenosylcobinamide-GDP ribazoletransferase [Actinokineospora globicatena]MCP2304513.1 cobalamin-5'-phosphate synthase [Actinokineospora globicatena]GLW78119.1 adenosylcobinamide-GDP ribazoletransferase [Actinokineospora globicatena]GLW85215.1 adenosylcobinamide-GDP ribazoletransferase [Actinokineospora globicatena]
MVALDGLRLSFHWLTVLPVPAQRTDLDARRWAIATAPVVGLALGVVTAGLLFCLREVGVPALVAGLLAVGAIALLTRGMHLDGLADTADGLGCYGPPERALTVMKEGGIGAFAAVALVIVIGVQAASLATLSASGRLPAVVLALTVGRAAFSWCCRHGVPAARPEGFGALVAGTQPVAVPIVWAFALCVAGVFVVPGVPLLGPAGVALAAVVVVALTHHLHRRFGGVTGDVFGANAEAATTAVLVVCAIS